ncbi:MAG: RimK/LysX family protein [Planctomycetota bacterium]
MDAHLPVLGWREWASLPELRIRRIKAKVDTGARTSSLHASEIQFFQSPDDGVSMVRFLAHPSQKDPTKTLLLECPLADRRSVRSSSGKASIRPVIRTTLLLGDQAQIIDLTLYERPKMEFRMLIGREAMQKRFVVDPNQSYVRGRPVTFTS